MAASKMAFEATATRPPVVTTEALAVGHVETLPVDVRTTSVDVARTAQGSAVARGQRWGMAPRCPSPMPLPPDFLEGPPDFEGRFAPQISGRVALHSRPMTSVARTVNWARARRPWQPAIVLA